MNRREVRFEGKEGSEEEGDRRWVEVYGREHKGQSPQKRCRKEGLGKGKPRMIKDVDRNTYVMLEGDQSGDDRRNTGRGGEKERQRGQVWGREEQLLKNRMCKNVNDNGNVLQKEMSDGAARGAMCGKDRKRDSMDARSGGEQIAMESAGETKDKEGEQKGQLKQGGRLKNHIMLARDRKIPKKFLNGDDIWKKRAVQVQRKLKRLEKERKTEATLGAGEEKGAVPIAGHVDQVMPAVGSKVPKKEMSDGAARGAMCGKDRKRDSMDARSGGEQIAMESAGETKDKEGEQKGQPKQGVLLKDLLGLPEANGHRSTSPGPRHLHLKYGTNFLLEKSQVEEMDKFLHGHSNTSPATMTGRQRDKRNKIVPETSMEVHSPTPSVPGTSELLDIHILVSRISEALTPKFDLLKVEIKQDIASLSNEVKQFASRLSEAEQRRI
ncbi:uncharacterized protein LOC128666775 [Bombina bombina]|uniref:uncharacterized protein LOC128666775 n=1 Tax=Bombina bombina TaxID=8345 RepID=UPI00235AB6F1|nr:uncharacterized protein LOC128666775 [Bombina bombina]